MPFFLLMIRPWRRWLLGAATLFGGAGAHAQTPASPPRPSAEQTGNFRCAFDSVQQAAFARQPGAKAAYEQFLARAARGAAQEAARGPQGAAPDVTIPVVVHIVFSSGFGISDAQVADALRIANEDLSKTNADTAAIVPAFQSRVANVGFRFRLAQKDPSGDCTTGITRTYSALASIAYGELIKSEVNWDPDRYLNIWVVEPSLSPGRAGYAFLPCTGGSRDGIVIDNRHFGSIGTAINSNFAARALTHEIGHYFGLRHTWGPTNTPGEAGNCGIDDGIADTPNTTGTSGCNLAFAPCTDPQTSQPILANVQNYMDYTSCTNMFTNGQRAVMRASLALSCRSTLSSAANLVATGTNDGYQPPAAGCPPVLRIVTDRRRVCPNGPVFLSSYGSTAALNDVNAQRQWLFPGGVPASSPLRTPTVVYATPGIYNVTLTVTPVGGGTPVSRTESSWVLVGGPGTGPSGPLTESFENPAFPRSFGPLDLRNWDSDTIARSSGARWRRVSGGGLVAANGTACLSMSNGAASSLNPNRASITSPAFDLSGFQGRPVELRFRTAWAVDPLVVNSASRDELLVQYGTDCELQSNTGGRNYLNGELIAAGQAAQTGFVPTSAQQWTTLALPLDPRYIGPSTWVRFVARSNGGNPFYLDDVRIVDAATPTATSAAELARRGIGVYPNPLTAETAVHFTLTAAERAAVRLTDMLGREVASSPAKSYGPGPQAIRLPGAAGRALPAGVYVVHLTLGQQVFTTRVLVPQ
ncbi:M43 family zinc metalloprotease [Hymenobacter sp.]|uniref:M43 family zinc metalloprotease n=1 Tax=Hymenobacter sp. TaxID=1898978 RepID=UPI00286C20C2|nr:M43 family zinc metalloprotease [Hymenobacter sp.]